MRVMIEITQVRGGVNSRYEACLVNGDFRSNKYDGNTPEAAITHLVCRVNLAIASYRLTEEG